MPHFDELNTIEQMTIDTLRQNGWTYVKAADLPRTQDSVLVEPMLRDALVRLNPCIAAEPSRADQVIYRLRSLILSARPGNLIAQNEIFKQFIFERNTFPFGKNGKAVPVRFFCDGAGRAPRECVRRHGSVDLSGEGRRREVRPRAAREWHPARHRRVQDARARGHHVARRRERYGRLRARASAPATRSKVSSGISKARANRS